MRPTSPIAWIVGAIGLWILAAGGAVALLSRTLLDGRSAMASVLILSQALAFVVLDRVARRARRPAQCRMVLEPWFDIGLGLDLIGLACWNHAGGADLSMEQGLLLLLSVGAACLFSASPVGFFLLGDPGDARFWNFARCALAVGIAVCARIEIDRAPHLFVSIAATLTWIVHAAYAWTRLRRAPPAPSPAPKGEPLSRFGKARENIVTKFVFRPVSRLLSPPLARSGISPHLVTAAALATGLGAGWAMSRGSLAARIVGALLLQVSFLFDCMDGDVARMQGRTSRLGAWLDWMVDRVVVLAAVAGLVVGGKVSDEVRVFWVGALAVVLCGTFPRSFSDRTSFAGLVTARPTEREPPSWLRRFTAWRERNKLGLSLGNGALTLVIGLGAVLNAQFYTLALLVVVRGVVLLYKVAHLAAHSE